MALLLPPHPLPLLSLLYVPGARSPCRQSRRALWLLLGLLGTAATLLPLALGAVTSVGRLYATAIPGAGCGALTVAAIEGVLAQI